MNDRRNYSEMKKIATKQFNKQQLLLAKTAATGLEAYYWELIKEMSSLVETPDIQQMSPGILHYLQHACLGYPPRTSIRLLDRNGILRFIYPFEGWRKKLIGGDYSKEPYFQKSHINGHVNITGLLTNEHGKARIRVAMPIYLTNKAKRVEVGDVSGVTFIRIEPEKIKSGGFIGVMVASFDMQAVSHEFISTIISGKTGYAWVLGNNGIFLAHHHKEFIGRKAFAIRTQKDPHMSYEDIKRIQQQMLEGKEGTGRYISGWHRKQKGKIEKLIAYAPVHLGSTIWSVAVCAPVSEVEEIVQVVSKSGRNRLWLTILILMIGGVAIFIPSYRWSHYLEQAVEKRTRELTENIADLKRTEKTLQYSERRYRLLTENITDIIWTMDMNMRLTYISPAVTLVRGYSVEEAMAQTLKENLTPASLEVAMNVYAEEMAKEEMEQKNQSRSLTMDLEHYCKDGSTVWVETKITGLRDPDERLVEILGISRDITERKRAEEEKAKLEALLLRSQKMEAIGTLAGGIAHDFNNMLFPVMGYTGMMLEDKSVSDQNRGYLNKVLDSVKRASDLVRQILTFSRQSKDELRPIKVQLIVKEALKLLRSLLPANIEINQKIDNDSGLILADSTKIHQVIMNLYNNAYHAMQEKGGVLEVSLTDIEIKPADFAGLDLDPGQYLYLKVSDTGQGMDSAVIERIFDPYFTTKENGKGSGLGLSIVYGIVKEYGGNIKVYSEPGKGSAFNIYLPMIKGDIVSSKLAADDETLPTGHEHILLVDDNVHIVDMIQQMLQRGYRVTARSSSIEALEAFRAQPDKLDLVITDMTMPNMTGDKLASKLMNIRRDIPIILSTGFSEMMDEEKAKALGIREFILKPVVISQMANSIRKVLDS